MALTAAYAFDEGAQTAAVDISGNGRDITVSSSAWTTGKRGWSLANNSASNITIGPSTATNRTIMCWFRIDSDTGDSQALVSSQPGGSNFNTVYVDPNGGGPWQLGYFDQNAGLDINGTFSLTYGTWFHAAVTTGSGGVKVYLNGSLIASNASTVSRGLTNAYIGSDASSSALLAGAIDDLRTFDNVLTSDEISMYMNTPVWSGPYVSGYTSAQGAGNTSTFTVNPSANVVSGSVADDDIIVIIFSSQNNGSVTNIPTPPGGWSNIVPFGTVGTNSTTFGVWAYRRVQGDTTYTWSQTINMGNQSNYKMCFIRKGSDISSWTIGSFDLRVDTGTTTTNVAASVVTTVDNSLGLLLSGERTTAAETDAQVTCSNFTKIRFDNVIDSSLFIGIKEVLTAGSTGSATVTYPNALAYNGIAGIIGIPPISTSQTISWMV